MKHINAILFFSLAIALFALPVHAQLTPNGPSLNASLLYYEPVPALPGQLLDVFVQITNNGGTAENVYMEFIDNDPFSIDAADDRIKSTGTIPAGESFLVRYKVRVSENAVPGENSIKIRYYSGDPKNAQIAWLPIDVFSTSAGLSIEDVHVSPSVLIPGRTGTVSFTIRNTASLAAAEGFVKLDFSDVDIIPVGSTNQQRFVNLENKQSREITFQIAPAPELKPGVYKIPLLMNFTDQRGNSYSLSETIGLAVGSLPDVSVVVDESALTTKERTGEVILRITNKGLGEVKFVNVELLPSDAYTLASGGSEQYIGNIDSDDYKTARLSLTQKNKEDTFNVPITVTYMDALNNPYARNQTITVAVKPAASGSNGLWISLVVIVLLIVGIVLYRRRSTKRR